MAIANIVLLLFGYCALVIEQTVDGFPYQRLAKVVIIGLFVISLSYYLYFQTSLG